MISTWSQMKCTEQYFSVVLFVLKNEPCGNVFIYLYYYMRNFCNLIGLEQ